MSPRTEQIGEKVVPLEFLRRKGGGPRAPMDVAPEPPLALPEEAVAEDHQLRLNLGAKTSNGVRLRGGPDLLAALPAMLDAVAKSGIEVVPPRDTTLVSAAPNIIHTDEATEWLRAHGACTPVTRHALWVLESLDAIDPAYDTFACALLDGDVGIGGYPEYAAVVGGVAAHWDESTGDLIVRAVVGWGGKGARGDTDRIASRLLSLILGSILENGSSLGFAPTERPSAPIGGATVTCQHCGYPLVHPRAVYCPKCGMRMLHA